MQRQVSRRARCVKVHRVGQGMGFDSLLNGVEQLVRNVVQVDDFLFCEFSPFGGGESREPIDRALCLGLVTTAIVEETTSKRLVAVITGVNGWLGRAGRYVLRLCNPGFDFFGACKGFCGEVVLFQQAAVVAVAGICPFAIDVRQGNGLQRNAGRLGDKGLDGDIVTVIVLHAGGGFDFHHAPALLTINLLRQRDVSKCQRPTGGEAGFKNRMRGLKEFCATLKSTVKPLALDIYQYPVILRVIKPPGNVSDLMPHLKTDLSCRRIFAQLGAMNFQPESFGALAHSEKL